MRGALHTNTVEGFFSIFKRDVKGALSPSSISPTKNRSGLASRIPERAAKIIYQASGKRLTYRRIGEAKDL